MKKERKIEDSPFHVEYHEKMKNQSFRMEKDMLKALQTHFKAKYHDDIQNVEHGKFRFGKYIRITLADYLQRQSLERKIFNKSLFALIDLNELEHKDKPIIYPLFVTNPSDYYSTKSITENKLLFYQVHRVKLEDFNYEAMNWSDPLQKLFNTGLEQYDDSSSNVHVLEIALNNYLDSYHDGNYSTSFNSNIHEGTNFIGTTSNAFGVITQWAVKEDYSIEILDMQVINKEDMLNRIYQQGDKNLYNSFSTYFDVHSKHFLEVESMEKECGNLENEILELQNKLKYKRKRIEQLKNNSDN